VGVRGDLGANREGLGDGGLLGIGHGRGPSIDYWLGRPPRRRAADELATGRLRSRRRGFKLGGAGDGGQLSGAAKQVSQNNTDYAEKQIKPQITREGSDGASRKIIIYPCAKRHNFLFV
jgi:hypothetical protein